MSRAQTFPAPENSPETDPTLGGVYFMAIPQETYKALSDLAMLRGVSVGKVIADALSVYLSKPASR